MYKVIGSRGSGKSYSIYSYAILNECDIMVSNCYNINYAIKAIRSIIENKYIGYHIDEIEYEEITNATIKYHSNNGKNMCIRIFAAPELYNIKHDNGHKVVCDELSTCMKNIFAYNGYELSGFSDSIE